MVSMEVLLTATARGGGCEQGAIQRSLQQPPPGVRCGQAWRTPDVETVQGDRACAERKDGDEGLLGRGSVFPVRYAGPHAAHHGQHELEHGGEHHAGRREASNDVGVLAGQDTLAHVALDGPVAELPHRCRQLAYVKFLGCLARDEKDLGGVVREGCEDELDLVRVPREPARGRAAGGRGRRDTPRADGCRSPPRNCTRAAATHARMSRSTVTWASRRCTTVTSPS